MLGKATMDADNMGALCKPFFKSCVAKGVDFKVNDFTADVMKRTSSARLNCIS